MIKKISAFILALVLCLSVVVMPASALELADGMDVAFELKWDKEYYNPGDTAYLQLYMKATDDMQLHTGTIVIGFNSSQITQADNVADDVKSNSYGSELWDSFYKASADSSMAWLAATVASAKVMANNTAAENEIYDHYFKHTINRNLSADHENASSNKYGLPGSDINSLEEPFFTYAFVVSNDVEEGTKLNASITSGTITGKQTAFKYIKTPGSSTTASIATTAFDVSAAVAESTIGSAATPFPTETIVNPLKGQIRFHKNADGTYAETFDVRALAVISGDDFAATFGDIATAESKITEVGFVFAAGSNVASPSFDAVQGLVENGTAADGYTKKTVGFISTSVSAGNYVFSCIATDVPDTDKGNSLVAVGYIAYTDANGDTVYNYYPAAQTISYTELFNAHYDTAFGA